MNLPLYIYWQNGYMYLSDGVDRISDEYEVPEQEFGKMVKMLEEMVNEAYYQGKRDKITEIQKALLFTEP